MINQAITIYCVCDEVVKTFEIRDDPQCKMSTSEVMTFALTSALYYGCDYKKCRLVCKNFRFFRGVLSHSQLVRRIHLIPKCIWYMVFYALQMLLRNPNNLDFIVDSFPVKAYENHKSFRAKIFSEKEYHGFSASKNQYFFGIKVHMIVDSEGVPVEFTFTPGSGSDIKALMNMEIDLPEGATLLGDRAYTNYEFEDQLLLQKEISLIAKRRKDLKRQHTPEKERKLRFERNKIETVFSSIVSRMPRNIRARTEVGFCLKVIFFILAYMINLSIPLS